jgi:hypothetical protein
VIIEAAVLWQLSAPAHEEHQKRSGACGSSKGREWIAGHPFRSPVPAIVEEFRGTLSSFTETVRQVVGEFVELAARLPEHAAGRLDDAVPGEIAGPAGRIIEDITGAFKGYGKVWGIHGRRWLFIAADLLRTDSTAWRILN